MKVDEKKLDALLSNSVFTCRGLYSDWCKTPCGNGKMFTPYVESSCCSVCIFNTNKSIKEWLKEEE